MTFRAAIPLFIILLLSFFAVPVGAAEFGAFTADGVMSSGRGAVVTIGGEVRADYSYRQTKASALSRLATSAVGKYSDLTLRNANLRLTVDVNPNITAFFKLDLTGNQTSQDDEEILEEALLVMRAVGGTGLELFAGRGRAPYGQDVTLGMIQGYTHAANRIESAQGRLFIVDPPDDGFHPGGPGTSRHAFAPMRPGQFDRVSVAGAAYEWDSRLRVELAAFQPRTTEYDHRLSRRGSGSDLGVAARLWWRPLEDLTFEVSGILAHSSDMGRLFLRTDLNPGTATRTNAYAMSAGFDWRPSPWHVYGEYQHGWNWNFTKDYDTDSAQLGVAREIAGAWRLGAMGEWLRIRDPLGKNTVDQYYKLALNIRYDLGSGAFVLLEYGNEWFRREFGGELADKRRGAMLGMRFGVSF